MDIRTWLGDDAVYKMLLKIRREWSPSEYVFLLDGKVMSKWTKEASSKAKPRNE